MENEVEKWEKKNQSCLAQLSIGSLIPCPIASLLNATQVPTNTHKVIQAKYSKDWFSFFSQMFYTSNLF